MKYILLLALASCSRAPAIPLGPYDMICSEIQMGDYDKIMRCKNKEAICYWGRRGLSCFRRADKL